MKKEANKEINLEVYLLRDILRWRRAEIEKELELDYETI